MPNFHFLPRMPQQKERNDNPETIEKHQVTPQIQYGACVQT